MQTLARLNQVLLASYGWHQPLFLTGLAALGALDLAFLDGWGTFWVMLSWGMVFGIHFMVFRAQTVDERWVQERTIFDVQRPWDTGHIQEIKKSPFGRSIYRTELGRVDEHGRPVSRREDTPAERT
ncbi:MAG: hypothetical protein OXE86_20700 [Alphaproteobacteria bacterium]|nr:hypothetical protein [Alphaproteobacteria bacterium]